jgi:hypothetical protein
LQLFFEIVVKVQAALGIPLVRLDAFFAILGALPPICGFLLVAKYVAHHREILLGFVEQAVQADGSVVMRSGTEWPEAK